MKLLTMYTASGLFSFLALRLRTISQWEPDHGLQAKLHFIQILK
jgi:hypothetical protein